MTQMPCELSSCVAQLFNDLAETPGEQSRWPRIRAGERDPIHPLIRRAVFDRDGHRCVACGIPLTLRTAQLDHIVPWSAGGTDFTDNLRTLCEPCNADRSNFHGDLDWWMAKRPSVTFECVHCVLGDEDEEDDADEELTEFDADLPRAYCFRCGVVAPAWDVY